MVMKTIENYEVLQPYFSVGDGPYYIVDKKYIERCFVYDCYNDWGGKIGHTDAGDYSLYNLEIDSAMYDMRSAGCKIFGEGFSDIDLYSNGELSIENYDELKGVTASEEEIIEWMYEWEKNNAIYTEADVITWWDGSNNNTRIIDGDEWVADLVRIDGSEILADFEKALQRGDVSESDYEHEYRGDVYCFTMHPYIPSFYNYKVIKLTDIEEE